MKEIVIAATRGLGTIRFREMWEYRELFYFLVWRDVKVRYKQTFLGIAWAVVRPLLSMVVFTFVFNRLAGFSSEAIPYPLFTYAGILAWQFFSEGITGASQSLLSNTNLITKVYFPRLIIPSAAVLRGIVDVGVAFALLFSLYLYFGFLPGLHLLLLPVAVCWGMMVSLGVGLWFSALGVKYRDVAHALPFVVQLLFWITPVGYSSAEVPSRFVPFYWLNPMTGVIEFFRYALVGTANLPSGLVLLSIAVCLAIFLSGVMTFKRMEREFADVI